MVFRFTRLTVAPCAGLALLLAVTPAFGARSHHRSSRHRHVRHKAHWVPGQRGIDADRTRAIQAALIKRNYLSGQPTGDWDAPTEAAMQKFQSDNGWQTKLMPDSRALIKLGLGPDGVDGTVVAAGNGNSSTLPKATADDTLAETHTIMN